MSRSRRAAPRNAYLPLLLLSSTLLVFLGLFSLFAAWTLGVFDRTPAKAPEDHTGKLAFPALVRPVKAFEAVTRDDFIDPRTGQLNVVWLPEPTAQVASRSMSEIIGRVVKRDKQPGMVLSEADFFEKGTRPGLAAGIPTGKLAISIPAEGVPGLEQLRSGDRFDLLVALPERDVDQQISNSEPAALFGGVKPPSLRAGQLSRQHGVKQLVANGMLVSLYSGHHRSTSGPTGLTVPPASKSRSAPPPQAVYAELAVDEEEVGPLTEAISLGTKLTCVLRSGQTKDTSEGDFSVQGLVPVITTAKPVNAFAVLSDENLIDEATGQLHYYYFPPEKLSTQWITDPAKLYGRVLARNLRRGALVTESDLLPEGTRPGISAGLAPGMSAMTIPKESMQGFDQLSIGDKFSILSRVPQAVGSSAPATTWASLYGGQRSEQDQRLEQMVRSGIREIAKDAVYLAESQLGTVVIGIPEEDVAKFAQLLRDGDDVFVVAHSSQEKPKSNAELPKPKLDATQHPPFATTPFRLVKQIGTDTDEGNFAAAQDRRAEDALRFPVLVRDVPAFRSLSIEDFLDPSTGQIQFLFFPQEAVSPDWQADIRQIIDRVSLRDLKAGRVVLNTDLAKAGTPASPALGIPDGMRGVTVNSLQIRGLDSLASGTFFDVISAQGIDVQSLADSVRQSVASDDAVRESTKLPGGRVPASRVIASNAILVANLGSTTVELERISTPAERQTQTRLAADGSTITETILEEPTVTVESREVTQFVIAVDEMSIGSVMGLLDPKQPLQIALRPHATSGKPPTSSELEYGVNERVRAVLQEHVRGNEITSEVFLTDRLNASPRTDRKDALEAVQHEGK